MFEIYNEARRHRDDPNLDHREYLASKNLSEQHFELLIGQLEPIQSEEIISTSLSQNCRGIYSHYLTHLKTKLGSQVRDSVNDNILDTRRRMNLHVQKPERASYGLVMGRIQSGKTAHMIGVSLHSIDPEKTDEPYDLVIILAGLIEDLRIQTNYRFAESIRTFTGVSPCVLPNIDSDISSTDFELRDSLTSSLLNLETNRMILVIKKNHIVLNTLHEILQNCSIPNKRILIIDDESDYASTDTGEFETEFDTGEPAIDQPSETNRIMRAIIQHFNLRCYDCMYLGYTATPFANLLSPESLHPLNSESGLSLFPRDFIHSLEGSDLHLDNQYYFAEPDNPNVRTITSFDGSISQERELIEEAIYRHIVTEIVKLHRGFESHHTTLIHTSREVEDHRRIAETTREILEEMKVASLSGFTCDNLLRVSREYPLPLSDMEHCQARIDSMRQSRRDYLLAIPSPLDVIEVNARNREPDEISEKNLRYQHGRRSYIAVGGTRLSRGLTLEGLTTSLFVRSPQVPRYDTMMQMSRWCGYRENSSGSTYADLVRIITTDDIAGNLRDIAIAEADLRRKIEAIPWNQTPLEQPDGVWIIETPGMSVTSEDKMQNIRRRTWGRMGTLPIWSYKSPVLISNTPAHTANSMFQQARVLLEDVLAFDQERPPSGASNFSIVRGIPSDWILTYLQHYRQMYPIEDNSKTVDNLNRLINQEYWEHTEWTVAIHTPQRDTNTSIGGKDIGLVNRSKRSNQEFAAIASSGGIDTAIDLDIGDIRQNPLIIIYLIDPASTQLNHGLERVFHNSVTCPVPAWGVCMPQPIVEEGGSEVRGGL
jgi:hypothetical protein